MKGEQATPALTPGDHRAHDSQAGSGVDSPGSESPLRTTADQSESRFRVITCVMGTTTETYLAAQEVLKPKAAEVDFHWDRVFGKVGICEPNGNSREYVGEIPGLGPDVGIPFLEDILWATGELMTERQLNGSLWYHWKTRNARDRQVTRLRTAFGDSATAQHYFIVRCRPWRIAWNVARSWRIIERP